MNMTKAQLIKDLAGLPDDVEICITKYKHYRKGNIWKNMVVSDRISNTNEKKYTLIVSR